MHFGSLWFLINLNLDCHLIEKITFSHWIYRFFCMMEDEIKSYFASLLFPILGEGGRERIWSLPSVAHECLAILQRRLSSTSTQKPPPNISGDCRPRLRINSQINSHGIQKQLLEYNGDCFQHSPTNTCPILVRKQRLFHVKFVFQSCRLEDMKMRVG